MKLLCNPFKHCSYFTAFNMLLFLRLQVQIRKGDEHPIARVQVCLPKEITQR